MTVCAMEMKQSLCLDHAEVLETCITDRNELFCDVTSCSLVEIHRRFGNMYSIQPTV